MFQPVLADYSTCKKEFNFFSPPELSSENLRTCLQIVNAYLYLSATDFLQVRHTQIIAMCMVPPFSVGILAYLFSPPIELCRVFVSLLLRVAKRHHKRGTGPSSEGIDCHQLNIAVKITLLLSLALPLDFYCPSFNLKASIFLVAGRKEDCTAIGRQLVSEVTTPFFKSWTFKFNNVLFLYSYLHPPVHNLYWKEGLTLPYRICTSLVSDFSWQAW